MFLTKFWKRRVSHQKPVPGSRNCCQTFTRSTSRGSSSAPGLVVVVVVVVVVVPTHSRLNSSSANIVVLYTTSKITNIAQHSTLLTTAGWR